jgi:hypothetical protein
MMGICIFPLHYCRQECFDILQHWCFQQIQPHIITPYFGCVSLEGTKSGRHPSKIGNALNIPKSTVIDVCAKYSATESVESIKRSGRPTSVGARSYRKLERIVKVNRRSSLSDITAKFNEENDSIPINSTPYHHVIFWMCISRGEQVGTPSLAALSPYMYTLVMTNYYLALVGKYHTSVYMYGDSAARDGVPTCSPLEIHIQNMTWWYGVEFIGMLLVQWRKSMEISMLQNIKTFLTTICGQ